MWSGSSGIDGDRAGEARRSGVDRGAGGGRQRRERLCDRLELGHVPTLVEAGDGSQRPRRGGLAAQLLALDDTHQPVGDLLRRPADEPCRVQRVGHVVDVQRATHHAVDVERRGVGTRFEVCVLGRQVEVEPHGRRHGRQLVGFEPDQASLDRRMLGEHLDRRLCVAVQIEVCCHQVRQLQHHRRGEEPDQELVVVTGPQLLDGVLLHLVQGVDDGHVAGVSSLVRDDEFGLDLAEQHGSGEGRRGSPARAPRSARSTSRGTARPSRPSARVRRRRAGRVARSGRSSECGAAAPQRRCVRAGSIGPAAPRPAVV